MKKKFALVFVSLMIMTVALFAPVSAQNPCEEALYVTMAGIFDGHIGIRPVGFVLPFPFLTRAPLLKPMHTYEDMIFTPIDVSQPPDGIPDIVQITMMPTMLLTHMLWMPFPGNEAWWRVNLTAPGGGFGFIFVNPMMPGDVDVDVFNNWTGVWWGPTSQLAGQMAAATGGYFDIGTMDFVPNMNARLPLLGFGMDQIPGTRLWGDIFDGFGNGIPDPKGSSILIIPAVMTAEAWNFTTQMWEMTLPPIPIPIVKTTANAYDIVIQPGSFINGMESNETGTPWELLASCAPWCYEKCNIKVTYASAWSIMDYSLGLLMGIPLFLDAIYNDIEYKVRIDQAMLCPDISGDQVVNIFDVARAAKAFGAVDEGPGPDGVLGTADDQYMAWPTYDAGVDFDCNGLIDIFDVVHLAKYYGSVIDP